MRLLLQFLEPEDKRPEWEKDVWNLENLGFEVRQNPIDIIRTIKFTGIRQEAIREEVKRASYIRIKYLSVGSLQGEIRAVRRFSEFLAEKNPEITSLGEVGRLNIEEYLTHINLERGQERNLKTEMANLKDMLQQVRKVIDKLKLGKLFIRQDMPKGAEVLIGNSAYEKLFFADCLNISNKRACFADLLAEVFEKRYSVAGALYQEVPYVLCYSESHSTGASENWMAAHASGNAG